jgi:hypothetical protein
MAITDNLIAYISAETKSQIIENPSKGKKNRRRKNKKK